MSEPAPLTRASIAAALEEEEARLRRLEAERAEVAARAESLRARLVALDGSPPARALPIETTRAPQSSADKVKLFRKLLRGREDVYPTRFVSKKTGKPGYEPACANKFVVGVCPLPKVKCGDCTNQAVRGVDDRAVRDHLQGRHVMGVYARGEAPLGYTEPKDDLIVQYDEDVLRTLDHESAADRDDEFAEWVP